MPTAKLQSSLLDLMSDSGDDLSGDGLISSVQKPRATPMMSARKPRGRPAPNKVTKSAAKTTASTRRAGGRLASVLEKEAESDSLLDIPAKPVAKATGRGRKATASKPVTEVEESVLPATPPGSTEVTKPKAKRRTKKEILEAAQNQEAEASGPRRRGRKPAAAAPEPEPILEGAEEETEIPETQLAPDADPMEIDEEDDIVGDLTTFTTSDSPQKLNGPGSVQKAGRGVPSEGEPALRRKLGEAARRYGQLETKYRDLRELGIKDAERNFDKFKKQADEKASASKELVASLKAELATQKELAREGQRLKKQLEASEKQVESLRADLASHKTSLTESKTEVKSLTMKLTASRNAEAVSAAKAVPGSAMKGGVMRSLHNTEAIQQATKTSQMKIDLYSDLAGLIIRSIKQEDDEEVFDCIQTGRDSRTLHFRLSICNDPNSENYEEAEFLYRPFLDESRDRELLEILPEYLSDEITFPRHQAAKFYAKVLEAMHSN